MSIDENEEIGYEPAIKEKEEGQWIKGKHDLLANGLSLYPYSWYYLIFLGQLACESKQNKENGPLWMLEKQIHRCVGSVTSNDTAFLYKYAN